jgi:hypothetical protein
MTAGVHTLEDHDRHAAEAESVAAGGSARERLEEAVGGELADRLVTALSAPRAPQGEPRP